MIAFAAVFFTGIPLTIIGAIIFGPYKQSFMYQQEQPWEQISFLIARYTARSFIEQMLGQNEIFQKIDEGVKEKGWKMLVITVSYPISI